MVAPMLFMFPGQGSQYPGMSKDWFENFQESKHAFEEASDGSGLNLKKLCFDGSDSDLKQTEITQPAILTATVAIFRALEAMGVLEKSQGIYAGHSLGEYSALTCMGVLNLAEAARIVHNRGRFMQEAVAPGEGAMVALIFKPGTDGVTLAQAICNEAINISKKLVSVANFNSPEQIVVAGEIEATDAVIRLASENENYKIRRALPLPVSAPFHCELMKAAADKLSSELESAKYSQTNLKYIANVDAELHDHEKASERLIKQITQSVQWVQSIQKAIETGAERALEIGPGAVLTGLAKRISTKDGRQAAAQNIDRWENFKNAGAKL